MTIYEIDSRIAELLDPDTGELLDYEAFAALQMEREAKIENMALWYKDLSAEAKAIRDEEKALEWFERGAASSDATTKLYVAWRFWKGDDTIKPNPDKAVYWCEQCLPKDGGVDRKKDKTELAALKMLKDIMQGKPAPDSLKDILDTGPVM